MKTGHFLMYLKGIEEMRYDYVNEPSSWIKFGNFLTNCANISISKNNLLVTRERVLLTLIDKKS